MLIALIRLDRAADKELHLISFISVVQYYGLVPMLWS
jgi:hypothetical protein